MAEQEIATQEQKQVITVHDEGEYSMLFDSGRFAQAWRVAKLFSSSKLVPATFQGAPESCFVAMHMAVRLNLDPMAVMQKTYIVHGRPGMEAQLVIALVNARGPFKGPIQWEVGGSGDSRYWTAYAIHKETGEKCEATVTWQMVKDEKWNTDKEFKNGGGVQKSKWNTIPDLMGRYRSAVFLARLYCPEVIMGLSTVDELQDLPEDVIEAEVVPTLSAPKETKAEKIKEKLSRRSKATMPDPAPEAQSEKKEATMTASEPPKAIQLETVSAILKAQDGSGISVADAMQALGFSVELPLAELDEISGQRLLGYYKSR